MDEQKSQTSPQHARREDLGPPVPRADPLSYFGKHRLAAAVSHLDNQIKILQEELDELQSIGGSSIACQELISSVESAPDPLLPTAIKGSADGNWDRWFRGAHDSRSHKR